MGIKLDEAAKVNQNFKVLKKVNNHLDVIDDVYEAKLDSQETPLLFGWAHVEEITESNRYPLLSLVI